METDTSGLSDEMREMLAQSTRDYIGWNPEEQPQIVGTVADIVPGCDCGGFGPHTILMIDEPNGNGVAVHAFHTTLRSQVEPKLKERRLNIGDLIAISHLGTKQSSVKGHNDMNMYRVVIRQQAPKVRYDQYGVEQ